MNTAIFSLIHDLFLRGLPFADPDQLVILQAEAKERNLEQLPTSDMNGLPHTLGCSGNHPRTPGVDSIVRLQSKCFPNQKLTSTTT